MPYPEVFPPLAVAEPGRCTADVDAQWLQGRSVFGGLQAVLAVRAMRTVLPQPLPLRTLQTTFIAPLPSGPVRIEAQLLRAGSSAVHVEARVYGGDQLACLLVAVFGAARPSSIAIALPPAAPARPPEQSQTLPFVPGVAPAFLARFRLRWADGTFPFCGGSAARTQVWAELLNCPTIDESVLIALADAIPSPALSLLRRPTPASSLTWTLELLGTHADVPATPWLLDAEVNAAGEGYGAQNVTLYDGHGRAVALSRQSVVIFG